MEALFAAAGYEMLTGIGRMVSLLIPCEEQRSIDETVIRAAASRIRPAHGRDDDEDGEFRQR
jgi:hypothetical protein